MIATLILPLSYETRQILLSVTHNLGFQLCHRCKKRESEDSPAVVGEDLGGVATTPLRLVDVGAMSFEMWIEEGKTKIEALDRHLYDQDEDFDQEMHRVYERDFQPLGEFLAQEMEVGDKRKGKERVIPERASVEDDPDDDIEERISQFSFMEGS